jgi:hypothetical protein
MKKYTIASLIFIFIPAVAYAGLFTDVYNYIRGNSSVQLGDTLATLPAFTISGSNIISRLPSYDCTAFANSGKLTINGSKQVVCMDDTSGGGSGGGTMIEIGAGNPNSGIKISSLSFDAGGFNVTNPTGYGFVQIDYVNGPASRSIAQTITGLWNLKPGVNIGDTAGQYINIDGANGIRGQTPGMDLNINQNDGGNMTIGYGGSGTIGGNVSILGTKNDSGTGGTVTLDGGASSAGPAGNVIVQSTGNGLLWAKGSASVSKGFEAIGYASASKYYGAGLISCTGANHVQWTGGLFSCASDPVGGGGSAVGFKEGGGGSYTNVSSVQFSASGFNLVFTGSKASISLDWTNGPASRGLSQTWTGTPYFSGGASLSGTVKISHLSNLTSDGFVKTSGGNGTLVVDGNTYLTGVSADSPLSGTGTSGDHLKFTNPGYITGNQTITLLGAVTGSGTTSITTSFSANASFSAGEFTIYASATKFYGANLTTCSNALTWTGGQFGCSGAYQPSNASLTALGALGGNGIVAQTGANTFANRTITGTTNQISVANGDGASANPTLSIPTPFIIPGRASVSGNFEVSGGTASISGAVTLASTLGVSGVTTLTGRASITSASVSVGIESTGFASASKVYGAGLASCTGSNHLQWTGGLFSCSADAVGGGGSAFQVRTYPGTTVSNVATISFDGGKFVVSASTSTDSAINLNWGAGGPASRALSNTWSALNVFNSYASVSPKFGVYNSGNADIGLNNTQNVDGNFTIRSVGGTNVAKISILGSASQALVTIASRGDVGINTTSPNLNGYAGKTLTMYDSFIPAIEGYRVNSSAGTNVFLFRGANSINTALAGFAIYTTANANNKGEIRLQTNNGSTTGDRMTINEYGASFSVPYENTTYTSSSLYYGATLTGCTANGNVLQWTGGQFSCHPLGAIDIPALNYQPVGAYLTSVTADAPLSGAGTAGSHLVFTNPGYITSSASFAEFTQYASATKFFGANLTTCGDGTHALSWTNGQFGCQAITATGGGGGGTQIDVGLDNPDGTKVSSISLHGSAFTLNTGSGYADINLNYTTGPASRAMSQTWTGVPYFSAGASVATKFEVVGIASVNGNVEFNNSRLDLYASSDQTEVFNIRSGGVFYGKWNSEFNGLVIQNKSATTNALSELQIGADDATNFNKVFEVGYTSSVFSSTSYSALSPHNAYLSNDVGNLSLLTASTSSGVGIKFYTGGLLTSNLKMSITRGVSISAPFELSNTASIGGNVTFNSSGSSSLIFSPNGGLAQSKWRIDVGGLTGSTWASESFVIRGPTNAPLFKIASNGFIMIGTTKPLTSGGSSNSFSFYDNRGNDSYFTFRNGSSGKAMRMTQQANSDYAQYGLINTNSAWLFGTFGQTRVTIADDAGASTLYPLEIEKGTPTDTVYLKSQGRVGINTNVPKSQLSLVDTFTGSIASGSFAIRSANTIGMVASISATAMTTGSVINVLTSSASTSPALKFSINNLGVAVTKASLSSKGALELMDYASASAYRGGGLASCTGANKLLWSAGVFSCGTDIGITASLSTNFELTTAGSVIGINPGTTTTAGALEINSAMTAGAIASISANGALTGSVFQITAIPMTTGRIFDITVPASGSGNRSGANILKVTAGTVVTASLSSGGDLSLRGGIYTHRSVTNCTTAGGVCLDYAESFAGASGLEAGDVVQWDYTKGPVVSKYDGSGEAIGVVSTNPGIIITGDKVLTGDVGEQYKPYKDRGEVPIALVGRVPVKTSERIYPGDRLAPVADGKVAKATKAGMTIGIALENSNEGKVMIMVMNTYWTPDNNDVVQVIVKHQTLWEWIKSVFK